MTPILQLILTAIITIGIGIIIVSLVRNIFTREKGLMMSKEEHHKICDEAQARVRTGIKEEFATFREYFDVEMENKVLKSLRNLNGTLEQKIADVVAQQVDRLGLKLAGEINKKLDLVEVLKQVVKK